MRSGSGRSWSADLAAGVVVSLVALPLCLGIALASGAPLVAGLITGVVGGVVVALVGRTPLLVSGPAAGLAAINLAAIDELGSFAALAAATVVAGILQLGLGAVRAGRLAWLVPSSVVTGMLAAIGVLIALQQLPYALGAPPFRAHGAELLLAPVHALSGLTAGPLAAAAITLAVLVGWERVPPRWRKVLPGPLVAVPAGTVAAEVLAIGPAFRVDLPELGAGLLTTPDWSALASPAGWRVAGTLAVVASLETLLSLEATDRLDPERRRSDGDRELRAQGLGNTVAGLLGGLPMTGVIVRSAANVAAGGRTWRSAFTHGVLLAVAVALAPALLERVPLAALAAILVHTGWKLAHPVRFRSAVRMGWGQAVPMVATVVAVVATDLLVGVAIGLLVSMLAALVTTARHGVAVREAAGAVLVELGETVSFVHKPRLTAVLDGVGADAEVTVDATRTRAFDPDVIELLHHFATTAAERGVRCRLVGVPAPAAAVAH